MKTNAKTLATLKYAELMIENTISGEIEIVTVRINDLPKVINFYNQFKHIGFAIKQTRLI